MHNVKTTRIIAGKEITSTEKVYDVSDFPYTYFLTLETVGTGKKRYINAACAFDIETTNVSRETFPCAYAESEYYAFMYQWQFCINDIVCFGRRWEEFETFLERMRMTLDLDVNKKLVVYVHSLSFEFQFMRSILPIQTAFITDSRKILKCDTKNFEFRCSYFLSNMSLSKMCQNTENVTYYKLIDAYDYKKLRTPDTPLTPEEEAYCYNDVRGLCEAISEYLRHDTLATIPLTSTGFVRREYRKAMAKNPKNRQKFLDSALTPELYTMMKEAFRGGNTHANRHYANQLLTDVTSKDIQSSYPAQMYLQEYPIGPFKKLRKMENLSLISYKCAYICRIRIVNARYIGITGIPYIPLDKCTHITKDRINDNGRILFASCLEMTVTDIDLEIIKSQYSYDTLYTKDIYVSQYGSLSEEFKQYLMSLYTDKTQLKGVIEMLYEYMKQKNRLNASYGMMVTDIAKQNIIYENFNYVPQVHDIIEALNRYYKSYNSFLSYQHGVWVTAHARKQLEAGLAITGADTVYCDTDSIKYIGDHEKEFSELNKKNAQLCEKLKGYADKDGKRYYLGNWDDDGEYSEFFTLGAKKYIYRSKKDNLLHSVVAGLSVNAGQEHFNRVGIEHFRPGEIIINSGHTAAYYNDVERHTLTINGCTFTSGSNVAIIDKPYLLGVTNEYAEILGIDYTKPTKQKKYSQKTL